MKNGTAVITVSYPKWGLMDSIEVTVTGMRKDDPVEPSHTDNSIPGGPEGAQMHTFESLTPEQIENIRRNLAGIQCLKLTAGEKRDRDQVGTSDKYSAEITCNAGRMYIRLTSGFGHGTGPSGGIHKGIRRGHDHGYRNRCVRTGLHIVRRASHIADNAKAAEREKASFSRCTGGGAEYSEADRLLRSV